MHHFRNLALLALLVLAPASVFAVIANPTVQVTITMTLSGNMRIEWTNGPTKTGARSWTNANVDLNSVYVSAGNIIDADGSTNVAQGLYITNKSNLPVNITTGIVQTVWTLTAMGTVGANDCHILASTAGGVPAISTVTVAGVVTANGYNLDPGAGPVVLTGAKIPKDTNQNLDLEFITPVTTALAGPAVSTVTLTATP
jgi:hypothetical protein